MIRRTLSLLMLITCILVAVAVGAEVPGIEVEVEEGPNPWSSLDLNNDPDNFHIAIIGDFSGQDSREDQTDSLDKRPAIQVDRDNFEEVFSRLSVKLKLPFDEQPLIFKKFDDLHPDYLYENVPLFEQFRSLKRKLKKQNTP